MSDTEYREVSSGIYIFTPSVGADGFIDYTGVEPDKIYLTHRKTVLNEEYPSYLPPVHIRRKSHYDIPVYKVSDNVYLLKESDELRRDEQGNLQNPRVYKVSLDVYAALVNYHLEFDRAAFAVVAKRNEEARAKALASGVNEYQAIREEVVPKIPGKFDAASLSETYTHRYPHIEHKPSRVALKSTKSNRMGVESFYFMQDMQKAYGAQLNRGGIFRMHRECLDDVNQKILDMELQKADWESTWTKGRETSYGDTNLDESLLQEYGVRVKRQNGEIIAKKEIEELKTALNQVHSVFGNISDVSQAWGLKISHAGNTKMHASKYVGLFTPYYRAIGISFARGETEASLTAIHEYAHFMDHLSGKELNAWHASDIPGTLENQIAVEFRGQMIDAKGAYWSRTCECFARAIEEYAQITLIRKQEVVDNFSLDSINKINTQIAKPGNVKYLSFKENIEPLVNRLLEQYRGRYTSKQREVSEAELVLENTASVAIPAIPHEVTIEYLQKEIYNLAVDKNRLDKEARSITEKINEERRILFEQELKRISAEIGAIDRKLLLHSESVVDGESINDLERQKKELTDKYNAVRYEFTPESEKLSAYLEKDSQLNSRLQEIEKEGMRLTLKLIELEKKEDERKKDESEHSLLTGTFTQLELFEKVAEYSAQEREEEGSVTEIIEGDHTLTREHIRAAKAAQRKYTDGILKGTKSGLWKVFRDFKKHGIFDIRGAQVATNQNGQITREGWEQLHQALNIYRDKRFETFRVLFVTQEGIINDQVAISSRLPNRVLLSSLNGELGQQVIDYAINTNTKIVLVHNHPSGNVAPSIEDESITKHFESTMVDTDGRSLVVGHIILDHNTFGLYELNTWDTIRVNIQGPDPLLKTRVPGFTQEKINGPLALRQIANQINESDRWNSKDWVPIAFTGADARINAIRYYSKEWFENTSSEDMVHHFQSIGIQAGAIWAFPILSDELSQDEQLCKMVKIHMSNGCFRDFYIAGGTSEDYYLSHYGEAIYSNMSKDQIRERTTTELTFDLEKKSNTMQATDESVASKVLEEYGGKKRNENLFRTDITPGLSAALESISRADIGKPNVFITITDKTPFVLTLNGLPDTRITMYRDKLARALYLDPVKPGQRFQHGHSDGLDKDIIKRIFTTLANPYYVFASKDGESQIGVYDINDKNGEPVIIAFNYNTDRNGVEANWVKALYGKKEQGIERWAEEGLLRYVNDKEKATELSITLQMRVMGSSAAYKKNIIRKSKVVNSDFLQEVEQEYASENGGRKMENNGKEANSLEPFDDKKNEIGSGEQATRIELAGGGSTSRDEMKAEGAIAYITWNEGIYGLDLLKFYDKESFVNALDNSLRDEPNRVGFGVLVDNDDLITKAKALEWHHRIDNPEINAQYTDAQLKEYGVIAYKDENIYGETYRFTFQDKESLLLSYQRDIAKDEGATYKILIEDAELENTITQKTAVNSVRISKDEREKGAFTIKESKKSYNQMHTERILDSLNTNSAPFLSQPAEAGNISIFPLAIRSAETGRAFRGMNQIIAQIVLKEMGGKDTEIITYEQAVRHGARIKKNSKGLTLTTYDMETKKQKDYRYYPRSAVYMQDKLPAIPTRSTHHAITITCTEANPENYLGKYLAATSLGAKFVTSVETMNAFKKNLKDSIQKSYNETKYTKIFEIGNKASIICKNTMSEIGQQKAQEVKERRISPLGGQRSLEPYNPVTGEKFGGINAQKAAYVMESRESKDPRFLELTDIIRAGLKLKDAVKEPLIVQQNGKSRFFYNAKDIEGIPPLKMEARRVVVRSRQSDTEMQL